jgi:hypothetical protein
MYELAGENPQQSELRAAQAAGDLAKMDPLSRKIYDILTDVKDMWDKISRAVGMAMSLLQELWNSVLEPIVKNVGNKLMGAFDGAVGSVSNLTDAVWRLLGYITLFIGLVYGDEGSGMSKDKKATLIQTVKDDIMVMLDYLMHAVAIKAAELSNALVIALLGALAHWGVDIINGTWTLIQLGLVAVATGLVAIAWGVTEVIGRIWNGIIDIMNWGANSWIDIIKWVAGGILDIMYGLEKGVVTVVGAIGDDIVNGIGAAVAKLDQGGILQKALRAVGKGD